MPACHRANEPACLRHDATAGAAASAAVPCRLEEVCSAARGSKLCGRPQMLL
jgi:hypothetical protein